MHYGKYRSPGNRQTQTHPLDCQTEKKNCHSREHISTALESSGSMFTPLHPTLCIALDDVRLGCSCSAMETHSMKLSMHCCCANLKAAQCLEVFSY
ncbi:unnamed protein product [Staurois parvus]|uniref:Uncharacterized protein n=1 Tax=Staurois parvus TaxID=386267 RepID=A0ABN9E146_9NEOB|nr:unnamed protein product [Staurois parvus]